MAKLPDVRIARRLRRNSTDAERKLWKLLRDRQLMGVKFRRQVPVGPYVADFLCFEARLVVEVDGGQHAASGVDVDRTAHLEREGFWVLRLWNNDVLTNAEGVLAKIALALALKRG